MGNELALGIDLGGTKIYAIVTDKENRVLSEAKMATPVGLSPEQMAGEIIGLGQQALEILHMKIADVSNIGVAVPAPVDPQTNDCHHAPNLGWKNFSVKETLSKAAGHEVFIGNDGNLGILGEYHCGAAKGMQTVIGYYVGTGLGGGLIVDGRLHMGNCGLAGEFGHATVKHGGRRCGCGHRGCAEAYCSKIAFVKALKKEIWRKGVKTALPPDKFNPQSKNIKSKLLARAYADGDQAVCNVMNKGMNMLGVAVASTCAIIAPDCVILGGGVMESMGPELFPVFKASFDNHLFGISPDKIDIRFSALGDQAVALGATILARFRGKV